MDIDFYNASSAKKLGWDPTWFGCNYFDDDLEEAIKRFQTEIGLHPDGMCGPHTFRRKFSEREAQIGAHLKFISDFQIGCHIVYNGSFHPIDWGKVVLWDDINGNGLKSKKGNYRSMAGEPPRDIRMFVTHWDAALHSRSTQSILDRRGLSVHFLIDNDGTIYQTADLQHVCFHAGKVNKSSIGVEISNAFYPKYQQWYIKNGYGERPLVPKTIVHNATVEEHLGFYQNQISALKALVQAVHRACNIPLQTPRAGRVHPPAMRGEYRGFVHHYQLTSNKIDCAGLDLETVL
tara:strand:+ start:1529 stop:2401 length:873 start_codon:yes stop_codon:yes gene_type:complete